VISVAFNTRLERRLGICIYEISVLHRPQDYIGFTTSCPPTFYNKIASWVVFYYIAVLVCIQIRYLMEADWTTVPCPSFPKIKQSVISVALKTPLEIRLGTCIYKTSLMHRPDYYVGFIPSCPPILQQNCAHAHRPTNFPPTNLFLWLFMMLIKLGNLCNFNEISSWFS